MPGPAKGHERRARLFRALLPCLALIALNQTPARAQSLTPDLFNPTRGGFVAAQDLPLRPIGETTADNPRPIPIATPRPTNDRNTPGDRNAPAPSRIGQVPVYGLPAANGAGDAGFDSLNRKRKPPKYYPAQARPKPPPGPGTPPPQPPPVNAIGDLRLSIPPVGYRQQAADPARDGRHGRPASRRAGGSSSTTTRSARSAIMPAAS